MTRKAILGKGVTKRSAQLPAKATRDRETAQIPRLTKSSSKGLTYRGVPELSRQSRFHSNSQAVFRAFFTEPLDWGILGIKRGNRATQCNQIQSGEEGHFARRSIGQLNKRHLPIAA